MKENKIMYIMPNFLAFGRNEILLKIYEKYPDIVRKDTKIYSFYGTFPKAIWNGGRIDLNGEHAEIGFMKKVRNFYNKRGIHLTFTFTNPVLKEEHLDDYYCNKIMEIFDNGMNEVLVASSVLEKYIRSKYPNYKINKSITATQDTPYDTDNYYLSVIDKKLNRDFDALKNIENKDGIEILCDEMCVNNCKFTFKHYEEIGFLQLGKKPPHDTYGKCRYLGKTPPYKLIANRNSTSDFYISPEDIHDKYFSMGYKYFKLSGREKYNLIGFESIINYCIKPEYQSDVRVYMLERMLDEIKDECDHNLRNYSDYSETNEKRNWKYI